MRFFADAVYDAIKSAYPDLPLVISIALKTPGSDEMNLISDHIDRVTPYADIIGVSTYPYAFFSHADKGDPENLPDDWLNRIVDLADGKPMAISETGWVGESLSIPDFGLQVTSDQNAQDTYLQSLRCTFSTGNQQVFKSAPCSACSL